MPRNPFQLFTYTPAVEQTCGVGTEPNAIADPKEFWNSVENEDIEALSTAGNSTTKTAESSANDDNLHT